MLKQCIISCDEDSPFHLTNVVALQSQICSAIGVLNTEPRFDFIRFEDVIKIDPNIDWGLTKLLGNLDVNKVPSLEREVNSGL